VRSGVPHLLTRRLRVQGGLRDLLASLLRVDVAARLSVEQALAHPWVANGAAEPVTALPALNTRQPLEAVERREDDAKTPQRLWDLGTPSARLRRTRSASVEISVENFMAESMEN
jgi:hypothetical protein